MTGQLEYDGIAAGIIVGTRMHTQRVGSARARAFSTHTQMVVMRTNNDVFMPQPLVLSRNHGDDVMSGALLVLPVGEIVIETRLFLAFDNRLEFHAAQLADDKLRGECVAMSGWISAAQLLRSQILYRLPHIVLPLGLHL